MPEGATVRDHARAAFQHSAFFYDGDKAYLQTLVPFLIEGLAAGDGVAVSTTPDRISLLRAALGDAGGRIRFLPTSEWYVRPVRTIAGWASVLTAATAGGRRARLVGETPLRDGDSAPGWIRFEAAVNRALAGSNAHLLCPYDRRTSTGSVVEAAERTHPRLCASGWRDSPRYEPPERLLVEVVEPPFPVSGSPVLRVAIDDTVAGLRRLVRDRVRGLGALSPERLEDLVLALSEVATNCIRYGAGERTLTMWLTGTAVVCEVTDEGATAPDPLAGYLPPPPGAVGGMGLWLAQQLCDAFAVDVSQGLTRVRFAVHRDRFTVHRDAAGTAG